MFIAMFFSTTTFVTLFVIIMISVMLLLGIGLTALFVVPMISGLRQNSILRQTGAPAQAKILKIWDTGVTLNDNPRVGLLLEVYAKDRPPFEAQTESIVSRLQIPSVQVGATVEVRYDPQDISRVALAI